MFLKRLDLTTALRPLYLLDEDLLFVQDNVGLYEGKFKILNQQNGQVYLTSHRICYVDKADPRRYSAALDLKEVDRYEFYAGFLKSSPKITLFPKSPRRSALHGRSSSVTPRNGSSRLSAGGAASGVAGPLSAPGPPAAASTWVCTICSFSNPLPSNFDPESLNMHTQLPPCLACGIQPTLTHVLKAIISQAANRQPIGGGVQVGGSVDSDDADLASLSLDSRGDVSVNDHAATVDAGASVQCPRCTFFNHPSLMACEICGAPLISRDLPVELMQQRSQGEHLRTESPGPAVAAKFASSRTSTPSDATAECIKLSFRDGGEKIFYERLKGAIVQRKWLLHNAPPIPQLHRNGSARAQGSGSGGDSGSTGSGFDDRGDGTDRRAVKTAGIAGLEKRGLDMRKNNEIVIGSAFEDLEALMASAKQIVALAETLARQTGTAGPGVGAGSSGSSSTSTGVGPDAMLASASSQLGLVATKDIVGGGSSSSSRESLYLSELARNLAEFLTDEGRPGGGGSVLRRAGGIMTLVDVWAVFNRARGGVELVSPMDLAKAAKLWETLKLPVRLRTFQRSGVLVVQSRDRTDDATVRAMVRWMRGTGAGPAQTGVDSGGSGLDDVFSGFGRGVTAQEVAERFGWSIGVAEEELLMAEAQGALCREEGIAGLLFWENFITSDTGVSV